MWSQPCPLSVSPTHSAAEAARHDVLVWKCPSDRAICQDLGEVLWSPWLCCTWGWSPSPQCNTPAQCQMDRAGVGSWDAKPLLDTAPSRSHLSHQNVSSCSSVTDGAQTGTLLILTAPLWGPPATCSTCFLPTPCLFLKVSPLFQQAKASTYPAPPLPLLIPAILHFVFSQILSCS